mgnify:CR=1 FL=1
MVAVVADVHDVCDSVFRNQSFIVSYVQSRHLAGIIRPVFHVYAVALLVLRLGLRDLFDSKGFRFWLTVCSLACWRCSHA